MAEKTGKLKVEYISIDKLKPYEGNVKRHPKEQVSQIVESIRDYGFNDPIAIDENGMIIEGHGRYEACKKLGMDKVPVIRLNGLTEEQKREYIIVHNKITMNSGFDMKKLKLEMNKLPNFKFDTYKLNFRFNTPEKENARMNTVYQYNLHLFNENDSAGLFQMPVIHCDDYIPSSLIGFNYAKTVEDKHTGIHMFVDDYQFERLWNAPEQYVDLLSKFECVLSPDFSLYMDMPMAMKIWNVYRSRLLGQFWQYNGIKVIPTISWAEKETFAFCFDGIPDGSIVAVSTIGVKKDNDAFQIWKDGMDEMISRIHPKTIIVYGGKVVYEYPDDMPVIYFENHVTERMKKSKEGK